MDPLEDDDPIVAEVRRIREEIAASCDYDYDRIAEYVRQQANEIRERMWADVYGRPSDDPIVAEIHREREEYAAKFGYDMKLIDQDTKRQAREIRARLGIYDEPTESDSGSSR
jgi:hypothetical protein